jgi:hypothetical protein
MTRISSALEDLIVSEIRGAALKRDSFAYQTRLSQAIGTSHYRWLSLCGPLSILDVGIIRLSRIQPRSVYTTTHVVARWLSTLERGLTAAWFQRTLSISARFSTTKGPCQVVENHSAAKV